MELKVLAYLIYLVVSILLTVWVARVLFRNGRIFLVDVFKGNEPLTDSVNRLLLVGFYLINLGYISLTLKSGSVLNDMPETIEFLSYKLGVIILVLGGMHFTNLAIFFRLRKKAREELAYPDYGVPPIPKGN